MRIALDYDGTFTAAPVLWKHFIRMAEAEGHEVVCVTMRRPEEGAPDMPCRVIFTSRKAKFTFCKNADIHIDIWIDDMPGWITQDAAG